MLAAGTSDDREQRRHRSSAERFAAAAANGSRDADVLAQSDFVALWLAYGAGDRNAAARAERFTTRRAQSGELALIGWVIRGELAFAAEQWQDATAAYRYVLGQGHPLHAYALYGSGDASEGRSRRVVRAGATPRCCCSTPSPSACAATKAPFTDVDFVPCEYEELSAKRDRAP